MSNFCLTKHQQHLYKSKFTTLWWNILVFRLLKHNMCTKPNKMLANKSLEMNVTTNQYSYGNNWERLLLLAERRIIFYLFPSRFKKCGYCKLKCRSSSVSSNGGLLSCMPPPIYDGIVNCGTGISCERSVLFELCILTASDSDERSAGRAVSSDSRVIVSEHNLKRIFMIKIFVKWFCKISKRLANDYFKERLVQLNFLFSAISRRFMNLDYLLKFMTRVFSETSQRLKRNQNEALKVW